jgi:hypothetical protein
MFFKKRFAFGGSDGYDVAIMDRLTLQKQAKNEVLRARCDSNLKSNVVRIASRLMLDESDVVRIAVNEYTQKFKIETALSFNR